MTNTITTAAGNQPNISQTNNASQLTSINTTNSNNLFSAGGTGVANLQSSLVQLLVVLVQRLLAQIQQQGGTGGQAGNQPAAPVIDPLPAVITPTQPTVAPVIDPLPAVITPTQPTVAPVIDPLPAVITPTQPTVAPVIDPLPAVTTPTQPTTAVPGQKVIDVYLLGGQSNAAGLGGPRLEKALEASLGADTAQHQTNVFTYAAGGTNLYSQWKADGTNSAAADGAQYKTFQSKLDAYMTSLRKANPDAQINISGMFWHQGESDALSTQTNRDNYDENLTRFIQDVRATTHVDNLPFVIGRLSDKQGGMSAAALNDIQKAQDSVGAADPWAMTVNLNAPQTSGIHFTSKGYDDMATLLANGYKASFKA